MDQLPLIIETTDLAHLIAQPSTNGDSRVVLLDLCRPENYQSGHIPGAIHIPPGATQLGRPPAPGLAPEPRQLRAIIEHIGLQPTDHVVVYDDEGGGWAGRMIWLLDTIGFHNYSYLNGGLIAWKDDGRELSNSIPDTQQASYEIAPNSAVTVSLEELQGMVGAADLVIWDARSPMEYLGQRQTAIRNGHIPGAVNYEWTRAMDPGNSLRLRNLEQIQDELSQLGITKDKRVVTHCQSHHRSGLTYLIGKALGFDIRAYAGSWGEWGNHPDTPVEI